MLFWIIATALVMACILAVYVPLLRTPPADATRAALTNALAAELAEIEADAQGRFATRAEAEAARAEVGRRLLALDREREAAPAGGRPGLALALALVPILAVPAYLALGQPEYADQPFATRADRPQIEDQREIDSLIARVERRLQQVPDDARGWMLIAPVYSRMGRLDDALAAYANALTHFSGPEAERAKLIADRAEVLVAQTSGDVTDEAAQAFREAVALDPGNQKALFFLAMHEEQNGGDTAAAIAAWQGLIDRFGAANPAWISLARDRLAALQSGNGTPATPIAPGPTDEQVEAAEAMADGDRRAMIEGMVEQLAGKLAANPNDAGGWARLIRSRVVLGQRDAAAADLATARGHFAEGTPDRVKLDSFASSLGL